MKVGAITPDPALENSLRESYQLPAYAGDEPSRYLADDPNRPDEPPALDPTKVPPLPSQNDPANDPASTPAPAPAKSAGARIPGAIHART